MTYTADIVKAVVTALMMVLTIFGNTAICAVIYRVRRLHCPSGFLLANLAVIDILIALILLPLRLPGVFKHGNIFNRFECVAIGFLQSTLSMASVLTLLAVTFDRFFAIVFSLRYNTSVTGRKTSFCIACVWIYSALAACFPFMGWGEYSFMSGLWLCETNYIKLPSFTYFKLSTVYFLPLLTILYLYFKIFKVSWRHSKQIRREVEAANLREASAASLPDVRTSVGNLTAASGQFCLRKPHSAIRSEIKTALTLAVVVGVLFVFWTPFIVLNLLSFYSGEEAPVVAAEMTSYLYYANGLVNPYVYGYLNRAIKHEIKKLYRKLSRWLAKFKRTKVTPTAIVVITPAEIQYK